ncbi:MAG: NAD(P)-dependent alcohol dehydrogenase [Azonexus sp.]|jgi:aryl-alcohol dehydrogenase|nr:NAD(P)-dependent alcohol dehydrogenase [Azonexus sp.]
MKTKAAIVGEKSGKFAIAEVELAELRDDEVLVRIVGVGVCHTDLICRDQVYPVSFPAVFGHEGSGIVEKTGARVSKVQVGDHVVLTYRACGQCPACRRGDPTHCARIFECNFSGRRSDGSATLQRGGQPVFGNFFNQSSFAAYALAHETNTVKVDPAANLEYLGPLGCGIQTGAGAVINTLKPAAGSRLAVFGCGSVGLAAIMAARVVGCTTIIAVDLLANRRALAEELGATHALDPACGNVVEAIAKLGGVDFSLECTGLPGVLRQAVDCLAVPGVCAVVGAAPPGAEVTLDVNSIMFGRTVVGVIEGQSVPDEFIPKLVSLYRQGRFPLDKLVAFYRLDEIDQAVSDSENGRVIKAILRP